METGQCTKQGHLGNKKWYTKNSLHLLYTELGGPLVECLLGLTCVLLKQGSFKLHLGEGYLGECLQIILWLIYQSSDVPFSFAFSNFACMHSCWFVVLNSCMHFEHVCTQEPVHFVLRSMSQKLAILAHNDLSHFCLWRLCWWWHCR